MRQPSTAAPALMVAPFTQDSARGQITVTSQNIDLLLLLLGCIECMRYLRIFATSVSLSVTQLESAVCRVCGSFGADFIKCFWPNLGTIITTKFVLHTDVFYERVSLFFSIFIVVYVVCVCVSFQDPA